MDELIGQFLLVFAVFVLWMKPESLAENTHELSIGAVRLDNASRVLQLNISWEGAFAEKSSLYDVKINHIPTKNCSIERSLFADRSDIKCAPVVAETELTTLLLPRDTRALHKHECEILPSCVYEVVVKPLDFISTLKRVYHVPDCVNNLCSCFHEKFLPSIRTNASISSDHLVVNWTLGEYSRHALPDDVSLDYITITVRRGLNEDLHWGGQESSKKSFNLPVASAGGFQFNVADFQGNKTIFLVHATLYDSRRCFSEAPPVRVFLSVKDSRPDAIPFEEAVAADSRAIKATAIALGVLILLGLLVSATVNIRRKRKLRRVKQNWPKVVASENHHFPSIPMEENRLYVEKEIEEARARGDADMLEVAHTCLRIGREIGKGAFGRVFMASAVNIAGCPDPLIVAVKQLKKSSKTDAFDEFLDEIAMMKRVGRHPNIVTLLGCCTIKEPLTMIMEYIGCGDLLEYLRKVRFKHEARTAAQKSEGSCSTPANPIDSTSLQRSTSNHSEITVFGSTIKYLDIGHASSSNSDASYIAQPETLVRPSLTDTLYTTLSGKTAKSGTSIEYVLDHNELHDFAQQIACGMHHLEKIKITHRSNSDASYIAQPETLVRPSLTDTLYTTLSGKTAKSGTSIEYVLDHNELHDFAQQIACGMHHLEKIKITHRDLAARNILIDERKTLKISDFGMSRTGIYVNTRNKKVPLRWLSIEAMRDNFYSSKSDVWAFGVVLWEIGTLGGFPYPSVSNHELLAFLQEGNRMAKPDNITPELYELMQTCWKPNPDDRPSFREIRTFLEPHRQIYIDFNAIEPSYVFPPTAEQSRQTMANNKS
ncbi:tyrosine-protein kinase receptor torso isoform X2 [Culex quinquefasciatus]|uniref:tyrosine-protein kinase receptor torso isoform X2 n=1 Tax=Culex quinquefasciatus TaxID=7176 RepID=UPI0018E39E51|nr:tyrosine-protein kinase receptor torso isoform X2 [Culex quinquefasciatus]